MRNALMKLQEARLSEDDEQHVEIREQGSQQEAHRQFRLSKRVRHASSRHPDDPVMDNVDHGCSFSSILSMIGSNATGRHGAKKRQANRDCLVRL
jgi:hypothetical protein